MAAQLTHPFCLRSLALILVLTLAAAVPAMQPPRPGELERYRQDGTLARRQAFMRQLGNHRVSPDLVARKQAQLKLQAAGQKVGLEKLPYTAGLPSKGTRRIFALLIDFPDYAHHIDRSAIHERLFGTGDAKEAPFESLTQFYKRSSYNQLTITGDTYGWYRASHERAYYTDKSPTLIHEALTTLIYNNDFTVYDNNGDGRIDHFIVIWTGPNEGWANFWWAWNGNLSGGDYDGKSLGNYTWIWEAEPQGGTHFDITTVMHETGHALGLPDLYDYTQGDANRGGVGGMDMMHSEWCDHNAFSKWLLDWITPTVISGTGAMSKRNLRPSATTQDAVAIMPGMNSSNPFTEFFMVQNRTRGQRATSNDFLMPAEGLAIWHVDATLNETSNGFKYNNSDTAHKLVKLMQADGQGHIELGMSMEPQDLYAPNRYLSPLSSPNSGRYPPDFSLLPASSRTGVSVFNLAPVTAGLPLPPAGTLNATFLIADASTDWMDIGNAVDNTALNWDTGGNIWYGQRLASMHDGDSARSQAIGHGQNASMGARVTGPGPLRFNWKVSSETGKDKLEFTIDGAVQHQVSGTVGWQQKSYNIPPGSHYLAWRYVKDAAGSVGSDCGWVDKVEYAFIPFAQAVDNDTTTWTHSGNLAWYGQGDDFTWGGSAVRSGPIAGNQASQFATEVTGPLTVQFNWKVSSESGGDALRLLVDSVEVKKISGETDWTSVSQSIASGKHTITWRYEKNGARSYGADCGWVDRIVLTDLSLAAGVDNYTLPWLSDPPQTWKYTTSVWHARADSVICENLPKGQTAHLKSRVLGPGVLTFWWKEDKAKTNGELEFMIDGAFQGWAMDADWSQKTINIGAGWHTLAWRYQTINSDPDRGVVDQVVYTPSWITLQEALDNPALNWETYGQPGWLAQDKVSSFGMDAAQSGAVADNYSSFLEGVATGPALLAFDWKVSSQPRGTDYFKHDDLEFYIDDKFRDEIIGEVGWQTKRYLLPKGAHPLRWEYIKDGALKSGSDCGWVDRVRVTPLPTLGEALDNPALDWITSGSQEWLGQPLDFYSGGAAARSGELVDRQSSTLATKITGPGTLRFYWKVSSQQYWDWLELRLDGARVQRISGMGGWEERQLYIPPGQHAVEWRYSKNNSFSDFQDCGWVDKVTFTPGPVAGAEGAWVLYR